AEGKDTTAVFAGPAVGAEFFLGKEVTGRKIPLIWVGLPAFESDSMTADAVQMNQLYRKQVESIGGEFVDIWDGFVDENGN
ncbi:hypothetical protein ACC722_39065, partial [Rhizobium ruizarguesonis]